MYGDYEVSNIIGAGLILLTYLFVAILFYYLLSSPIDIVLDAFTISSIPETGTNIPILKTALNIVFAFIIAFPVVWFIVWVFSREPDVGFFRRT